MCKLISRSMVYLVLSALNIGAYADTESSWSFTVAAMPKVEGSVIVKMGMGSNFKYTAGSADAIVNFSMPGSRLMIKYQESKITCVNSPNTIVNINKERAIFSGTVRCFSGVTRPDDRAEAAIEGWLDMKD